jgi:hypothetical protein
MQQKAVTAYVPMWSKTAIPEDAFSNNTHEGSGGYYRCTSGIQDSEEFPQRHVTNVGRWIARGPSQLLVWPASTSGRSVNTNVIRGVGRRIPAHGGW